MESQISDKIKKRPREQAMAIQHAIAQEDYKSFVGREFDVLVESAAT